ncbi:MAG: hypothetical protein RBU29_12805 [bacterium]|nr:hypothetical protein [bacterium]
MNDVFRDCVSNHFSFLLERYDFHVCCEARMFVCFENTSIKFVVEWDSCRSYEMIVEFRFKEIPRSSLPLYYLMKKMGSQNAMPACLHVMDVEVAGKFLRMVSDFVKSHMADLLMNNNQLLMQVYDEFWMEEKRIAFKENLSRIVFNADVLWKSKDFKGFVNTVSPVLKDLSPLQQKRYDYAIKHMNTMMA